jgi:proline iminopeptidase
MSNHKTAERAWDFYPAIEPYHTQYLKAGDLHQIYVEESGNPKGFPVLFLHGGPGAGAGPNHRRFFDPAFYRIIIFDQRGSGRSKPLGEIRDNTTPLLIEDIEMIRHHLKIDRWMVFGGSWGSTLAIAYAETHPDRCVALALRGIFLCRPSEIEWFLYGIRMLAPKEWRTFATFLPEHEQGDLLRNYYRRLFDPNPAIHMPAAKAWSVYEGSCSTLLPNPDLVNSFGDDRMALGLARMEAHYFMHDIFLPPNALLNNIDRIRKIPAAIVQGRYDLVCPIETADALVQRWPEASYIIVNDAGHAAIEPGIRSNLIGVMERFKSLVA